jgi:F-type H+-transporting ATPase subunit b
MEIVTQNELVSINATMIVQVISFLIFLFLIQRVMFRPLLNMMDTRRTYLKQLGQEIKAQEKQLAELSSKIQKEEATLKAEAFLESEKLETAGKQEARGILRKTREEMTAQRRQAADDIRIRIESVQHELVNEAEPLVAAIIEKVLERRSQP